MKGYIEHNSDKLHRSTLILNQEKTIDELREMPRGYFVRIHMKEDGSRTRARVDDLRLSGLPIDRYETPSENQRFSFDSEYGYFIRDFEELGMSSAELIIFRRLKTAA